MSRLSKGMYKVVHITFQNVTLIRRTQLPKFVEATNGLLELVQAAKFPRLREFQLQFNLTVREFNMLLTHCPRLAIIRISPETEEYPVSPAVPAEAFTGLTSPLVNLKCLSYLEWNGGPSLVHTSRLTPNLTTLALSLQDNDIVDPSQQDIRDALRNWQQLTSLHLQVYDTVEDQTLLTMLNLPNLKSFQSDEGFTVQQYRLLIDNYPPQLEALGICFRDNPADLGTDYMSRLVDKFESLKEFEVFHTSKFYPHAVFTTFKGRNPRVFANLRVLKLVTHPCWPYLQILSTHSFPRLTELGLNIVDGYHNPPNTLDISLIQPKYYRHVLRAFTSLLKLQLWDAVCKPDEAHPVGVYLEKFMISSQPIHTFSNLRCLDITLYGDYMVETLSQTALSMSRMEELRISAHAKLDLSMLFVDPVPSSRYYKPTPYGKMRKLSIRGAECGQKVCERLAHFTFHALSLLSIPFGPDLQCKTIMKMADRMYGLREIEFTSESNHAAQLALLGAPEAFWYLHTIRCSPEFLATMEHADSPRLKLCVYV
eukprot:201164_1